MQAEVEKCADEHGNLVGGYLVGAVLGTAFNRFLSTGNVASCQWPSSRRVGALPDRGTVALLARLRMPSW